MKKICLKICCILLMAVLTLSIFTGCKNEGSTKNGRLTIVTTIFPPYDFAREIAGGDAEVKMLVPAGADSHSYEPTLEDIADINNCDIFIHTGGDTDSWCQEILENADKKGKTVISMLDTVEPLYIENEHNHSGSPAPPDEHVWTSPENAAKITNKIIDAAKKSAAENAENFQARGDEYLKKLEALDADFKKCVAEAERKTLVFADRFPFIYFTEHYGLRHFDALDGCTSDTEPTLTALAELEKTVKEQKIPAVLYMENSSGSIADKIQEITGCEKYRLHSCHSLSEQEIKQGKTYLGLMRENLEILRKVLN